MFGGGSLTLPLKVVNSWERPEFWRKVRLKRNLIISAPSSILIVLD